MPGSTATATAVAAVDPGEQSWCRGYRGTSLIRNSPPPRTTIGP